MTTNANYTAGPWVPSLSTMFIRTADGRAIASIYGDRSDCLSDECGRSRTRLIAAAPDLLVAAKAMVEIDDRDALTDPDKTATDEYRAEVLAKLRAAIAMAEGGAT